jgi:hypothetical protein
VLLRWAPDWTVDRGGVYTGGAWIFDIDETKFPFGIQFKFVLAPGRWSTGPNLFLAPAELVGVHDYGPGIAFPAKDALVTERGVVPQKFFPRNLSPDHTYDVIVVGSGMGGGLLASKLADAGADVLLLEAGSYLFPTHVANLPRRLKIGQFDKHIWSLWPDFKVINYVNAGAGSAYAGGQGFNLGGRSLFWGGLIPRQVGYELANWPAAVRADLLGPGYPAAEAALNRVPPQPTAFQDASRQQIDNLFPGYDAEDAGVAVQYSGATKQSIPAGLFSTADLLMEDRLLAAPGYQPATVNLNFAVWSVTTDPNNPAKVTGVTGWDLLGNRQRTFVGDKVVICAGTLESAKIALQSGLADPNNKIGKGVTDHAIRYRHFTLPPDPSRNIATDSAKVLLRHPGAAPGQHAFDVVVEYGADFNQGRYVASDNLAQERVARNNWMLCELVLHQATLGR